MIELPNNVRELEEAIQDGPSCLEYITSVRYPGGLSCPECQNDKLWRNDNGLVWQCSACGHKVRPLVGTIFQDTHLPIQLWLKVMWQIVSQKYGTNATGLSRTLGLSYPTTWNILHKLRRCMVRSDREPLSPAVEVDETYIGGLEEGMPGRGAKKKTLVAVATELAQDLNVMGRIRLEPVPDASSDSLIPFVVRNVSPGSTVVTDGWTAYNALERAGFKHVILEPKLDKTESSPHVHLVVSLPKRWINGTFQGSISHSNLPYYLDEFVFRFNRRHSRSRINLLKRLVEQAVVTPPVTRMEMVKQIQGRTEFAIKDR